MHPIIFTSAFRRPCNGNIVSPSSIVWAGFMQRAIPSSAFELLYLFLLLQSSLLITTQLPVLAGMKNQCVPTDPSFHVSWVSAKIFVDPIGWVLCETTDLLLIIVRLKGLWHHQMHWQPSKQRRTRRCQFHSCKSRARFDACPNPKIFSHSCTDAAHNSLPGGCLWGIDTGVIPHRSIGAISFFRYLNQIRWLPYDWNFPGADSNPILCSTRYFMTPVAASNPKADPPASTMHGLFQPGALGASMDSRVPGPPLESIPPTAPLDKALPCNR
jgi:hypothetical protein